jgi:hypothetical protein
MTVAWPLTDPEEAADHSYFHLLLSLRAPASAIILLARLACNQATIEIGHEPSSRLDDCEGFDRGG